jgi:hypothetical protein
METITFCLYVCTHLSFSHLLKYLLREKIGRTPLKWKYPTDVLEKQITALPFWLKKSMVLGWQSDSRCRAPA